MKPQHYYNEHDPRAAQWLRELMRKGHIPRGRVDERSIADVRPADLAGYTQVHLFAGISGWSLALRLAGVPESTPLWTGSPPCQPFSVAGKGLRTEDSRDLFPHMERLIRECRPSIVFGEQVAGPDGLEWITGVQTAMEAMGYAFGAADLCAAGVGAPHIRQRLYWLAYSHRDRLEEGRGNKCGPSGTRGEDGDDSQRRSRSGGLGITESGGCGERRHETLQGSGGHPDGSGDAGAARGLAYSQCDGGRADEQGRRQEGRETHGRPGGLGDTYSNGSQGLLFEGQGSGRTPRRPGAWDNYDVLYCTDDRARRIESGTFPLATRIPGRVGLLRGYGNAIVPQAAALFITAAFQSI